MHISVVCINVDPLAASMFTHLTSLHLAGMEITLADLGIKLQTISSYSPQLDDVLVHGITSFRFTELRHVTSHVIALIWLHPFK